MTHSEKLAAVRQKIVDACPQLKKAIFCSYCEVGGGMPQDPRIEHVLRALDKHIGLWEWHPTYKPITVIEALLRDANWQLDKDLSGQPEFTIDFLYNVFYGNKNWKLC